MPEREQPREIPGVRELSFDQIKGDITVAHVGELIHFDTVKQFDESVATAVWVAMGQLDDPRVDAEYRPTVVEGHAFLKPTSEPGRRVGTVYRPSEQLQLPESTFWGSYQDYSLMMLSGFQEVDEADPRYFLANAAISVDLHYSGRGAVATHRKLMVARTLRNQKGTLQLKYRDISGNNAKHALELLKIESASQAKLVALHGLRHVVSGGLPSLGKRR